MWIHLITSNLLDYLYSYSSVSTITGGTFMHIYSKRVFVLNIYVIIHVLVLPLVYQPHKYIDARYMSKTAN